MKDVTPERTVRYLNCDISFHNTSKLMNFCSQGVGGTSFMCYTYHVQSFYWGRNSVRLVILRLKVVMQSDWDFVEIILLWRLTMLLSHEFCNRYGLNVHYFHRNVFRPALSFTKHSACCKLEFSVFCWQLFFCELSRSDFQKDFVVMSVVSSAVKFNPCTNRPICNDNCS